MTESSLKERASIGERWSKRCGFAVVAGLVIEVCLAIAYREHKTWIENWAPVIGDILVALGVYGEIHFAGIVKKAEDELRRISEEKVAAANERAANAELELGKLQTEVAPRVVNKAQHDAFQTLRGKVDKVNVTWQHDSEAISFAFQIIRALRAAGVVVEIFDCGNDARWSGVYLSFPPSIFDHVGNPLTQSFISAGLYGGSGDLGMPILAHIPTDVPLVMVGEKYMKFFEKPYMPEFDAAKSSAQKSDE